MKLYIIVGSPNCRKVLAAASHLGVDLEVEYMDFFTGELRAPSYLALNPNGMVPTLRDGEFALSESNAIMQYLADAVPGQGLFPRDPKARADVVRWLCWELAHYNKAFGVLAFEAVAKPNFLKMAPDEAKVRISQEDLARFAPVLDAHLKGRHYAVGDGITLADYSLIHLEAFQRMVPFDWSPYPHLNAYYERMRAVPHWAKTAPEKPEAIGRRPTQAA